MKPGNWLALIAALIGAMAGIGGTYLAWVLPERKKRPSLLAEFLLNQFTDKFLILTESLFPGSVSVFLSPSDAFRQEIKTAVR